jgi:ADP-ribose pyrophosphatase YjhB (NUDIX family)
MNQLGTVMTTDFKWLTFLQSLQSIAQAGLAYPGDKYDKERFQQLRDLTAEAMANISALPTEHVKTLFCNETGFQTPKIDTRAVILNKANEILLVCEGEQNKWSLPGGWCEVTLTPAENTIKEALEEAGLHIRVERLIMTQWYANHNRPPIAYGCLKLFYHCSALNGSFRPNIETSSARYFPIDELPELWENRNTAEQIRLAHHLALHPQSPPIWE